MELLNGESANDDQRFQYQPLADPGSSIRLIEVEPDLSTGGTLQVHLFDSALSEEYTCLSYVWGQEHDGGGPFPILVNGKNFHVRWNLNGFLQVARRKYPNRRFWIDAICIDQTNTPERSHQVQQMGEIYSGAKEVIAWLGDDQTAAGFIPRVNRRAHHVLRHLPVDIGFYLGLFVTSFRCCGLWLCLLECLWERPSENACIKRLEQREAFQDLIRRYWARGWITQEIALAKHVCLLVHETELDLTVLEHAKLGHVRQTLRDLIKLSDANTRDHHRHDRYLVKLLSEYRKKQCKDERDRVYSLLSLCLEREGLQADYSLSKEKLLSIVLRTLASRLVSLFRSHRSPKHQFRRNVRERSPDAIFCQIHSTGYGCFDVCVSRDRIGVGVVLSACPIYGIFETKRWPALLSFQCVP
ncbi:hypothetical protein K491DRAFT_599081 [Lophiostoma macrostomum CBS 122681]|uniref:Heterokaryon incompatibility domain-containing protein n=1 Tax=Lophiostoma macrostomum CBS 122681 TaxID=1314788 RepID=A0A6A6T9P3_9PLEO|nr:hypothetical protein K491DRAFT_599081 [Lophiostoma macrostomum CBS 122681]